MSIPLSSTETPSEYGYPNKNSNDTKVESEQRMIQYQLNSKTNGPVLLLISVYSGIRTIFLFSVERGWH